jgi:hypothetical protein
MSSTAATKQVFFDFQITVGPGRFIQNRSDVPKERRFLELPRQSLGYRECDGRQIPRAP